LSGGYLRNIVVLVTGTALAQGVTLAFSPLIARLYQPADYAVLTMFLAIVGMIIPFACGKYEVAIVIADTERHASELTALSLIVASAGSVVLFGVALATRGWIATLLHCEGLGLWLLAVPLGVLFGSVAMVFRYVANRQSAYRVISHYLVIQAALSVALSVLFGLLQWEGDGLLSTNLIAAGSGTAWLVWILRENLARAARVDIASVLHVANKHRDFPIFNASSTILDAFTLAMPVFFIARIAGQESLGLYGFMMRVTQAPFALVASAVSQVHTKHLSDLVAAGQPASAYLRRITIVLAGIAVVPSMIFMLFGPQLFAFAFGEHWRKAGEMLVIMTPSIGIQIVVSTLSPACVVAGHNRLGALWKVISFAATLSMFLALSQGSDLRSLVIALSATNVLLYLLYWIFIWYAVANPRFVNQTG
jgi:O-antigen/teichoic acid export membrane protein